MPGPALILGGTGMVGHALHRAAQERGLDVVGTARSETFGLPFPRLELTDAERLRALIRELRPATVLVPAALTHVDGCETDPAGSRRVNVEPFEALVPLARELGFRTVFFSTDYVFDGGAGPYAEGDVPNPICEYGRQKLEVERLLAGARVPHLVVRTTGVYGPELRGKNFVLRLVEANRNGDTWRVPRDQLGTPTYAPDLAAVTWDLLAQGATGVWHVGGGDVLDRHAFALEVARVFDLDPARILSVETNELGQAAPRPLRGGLVSAQAEAALGRRVVGVGDGLQHTKAWLEARA